MGVLKREGIHISMDGKGCRRDNVFLNGYGAVSNTVMGLTPCFLFGFDVIMWRFWREWL